MVNKPRSARQTGVEKGRDNGVRGRTTRRAVPASGCGIDLHRNVPVCFSTPMRKAARGKIQPRIAERAVRSKVMFCAFAPMRILLLCGALTMAASGPAFGVEFYEVKDGKQPNHLVPIDPHQDEYDQRLAKHLFVTDGSFGRLLVRPSFEAEFCVSVHADIAEASIKKHGGWWAVPDEEKTYFITVTTASESIWHSMAGQKDRKRSIKVKTSRVDRKIGLELAVAIQRVWAKALHLTHYPSVASNGLDGVTYQFSVAVHGLGNLHGQSWSPDRGLPRELTDVGLDLVAFGRQDAKGKQITEQQLIDKLRKLESTIPQA